MAPVLNITRGPLFVEPITMNDAWVISIIEQKFLYSAYSIFKHWTSSSSIEELLPQFTPDFSSFSGEDFYSDYEIVFNIIQNRWIEIASFYSDLNPNDIWKFMSFIFSDLRNTFFGYKPASTPSLDHILNMYHLAYVGYIDYYIDIYNVYLEEFSNKDLDHSEKFPAWFRFAHDPEKIHIVGDPSNPSPSPAHWIELSWLLSENPILRIIQVLANFQTPLKGELKDHIRIHLIDCIFHDLVMLFQPIYNGEVVAYPLNPAATASVPKVTLVPECSPGEHKWSVYGGFQGSVAECYVCKETIDVDSLTDDELDQILLSAPYTVDEEELL